MKAGIGDSGLGIGESYPFLSTPPLRIPNPQFPIS